MSGNLAEVRERSGNLAEVRERSGNLAEVRERSGNFCTHGSLIVAAEQNAGNKTVFRSSYNLLYFIRSVIHFSYVKFTVNSD